jgi:pimeloyl-ACP methyl ester carboxylesterase
MPRVTVGDATLHYLDEGSGDPPVVLLHAFPLSSAMWEPQLEALAGRHRLIAPDVRGFGGSPPPPDPERWTMEAMAADVAALLARLGVGRAVVAGLSMGGYLALTLLRHHRDLVGGLVLADTRAGADTAEVAERRTAQQARVQAGERAVVLDGLVDGLLGAHTREHRPDVVRRVREWMEAASPEGIVAALAAMKGRPDARPELGAIDVPTLIVVGEEDGLSPPDVARDMQVAVPGAELAVLPRAGHLSSVEAAEAFDEALAAWLERVPATGR